MDLSKVLQQLHEELRNLNYAIASLERLQEAGKNRGKDPKWLEQVPIALTPERKRKAKAKGEPPKKN